MNTISNDTAGIVVWYLDLPAFITLSRVSQRFLTLCLTHIQNYKLLTPREGPRFKRQHHAPKSAIAALQELYTCPSCETVAWNICDHESCWKKCIACKRDAPTKVVSDRYIGESQCTYGCMPICAKCHKMITYVTMPTFVVQSNTMYHSTCGMPLNYSRDGKAGRPVEVWMVAYHVYSEILTNLSSKLNRAAYPPIYNHTDHNKSWVVNALYEKLISDDSLHPFITFLNDYRASML